MKEFFASVAGIVVVIVIIIGVALLSFGIYAYFQPKYVQVQNTTFHQSQQYNDHMAQHLEELCLDYQGTTSTAQKETIASLARHDFASYDPSHLTMDLQQCLAQMKAGT